MIARPEGRVSSRSRRPTPFTSASPSATSRSLAPSAIAAAAAAAALAALWGPTRGSRTSISRPPIPRRNRSPSRSPCSRISRTATSAPRSRGTAEAARAAGLPTGDVFHTEDMAELVAWARARLGPGDLLLVKASRGMVLERLVEGLR